MRKILFLCLMLFVCQATHAHSGSIKGIISDAATGRPVDGATLNFVNGQQYAFTDITGHFFAKGLQTGRQKLVITCVGFEALEVMLSIEEGVTIEKRYELEKSAVQMKDVSISAKKDFSFNAISSIDIKQRPVNSSQDILRLVPGLFIAQHQGGGKAEQIFLRGFDCDHGTDVNVSVDNMPVNMVSHAHGQGFADAHFIIPESVQGFDFGKGPGEIDKGNMATAGFVAFRTLNGIDKSFVKAEAGSFGYYRTVAGLKLLERKEENSNRHDAYIMGEYGRNRGYFDLPQQFNRINLFAKYSTYIGSDKVISLSLSGFHSVWDASGQLPTRAVDQGLVGRWGTLDPESGATGRYNINFQYFQNISNTSYVKANFYATAYTFKLYSNFTFYLIDSVNGDQIRQAEDRKMLGYNSEYTHHHKLMGMKATMQVGTGLRQDEIRGNELSYTVGRSVLVGRISLGDIHETHVYGYVNEVFHPAKKLTVNIGSRYDFLLQQYDSKLAVEYQMAKSGAGRANPKFGITYNQSDAVKLYYRYGTGFHSNDARTLALGTQLSGDVTIRDAIPAAFGHDLGVITKIRPGLIANVALWRLDMQQEFDYSGDAAVVDRNGSTRRYGIDVSARYEVVNWLYLDLDVNYARGRYKELPAGANFIPLAPAFTSTGGATFKLSKAASFGLRYRHMGDRPANEDNSRVAVGYTVFDLVGSYAIKRFDFDLQVQNILNAKWSEAQFDTETRLRLASGILEQSPATDVCFSSGTPFFLKAGATYKF